MDKKCTKCQVSKIIGEFSLDKTHIDGHRSICKKCIREYMKSYLDINSVTIHEKRKDRYYKNIENAHIQNTENRKKNGWKWKIRERENHRNNPIKRMISAAKIRAKRKNMEFDISENDLKLPTICPVLGIPLYVSMTGKAGDNSPTLDRINNTKGYTKDNTIIVSFKANTIKNTATIEELEKVLQYYKHHEILR